MTLRTACSCRRVEAIIHFRALCRARHKPRYVECRIMWSCAVATATSPDGGGRVHGAAWLHIIRGARGG